MARSYELDCPVARALDIVGERWTLLILRDLLRLGPRRFSELQEALPGVAPNTLSDRLKTLESGGIVESRLYERHPPRVEYVLTSKGAALGPVMKALHAWGQRLD
jgi:DNA-binding HxlR family transcriptional regulator